MIQISIDRECYPSEWSEAVLGGSWVPLLKLMRKKEGRLSDIELYPRELF